MVALEFSVTYHSFTCTLPPGFQTTGAVRAHSQKQGVQILSGTGGRKADTPLPLLHIHLPHLSVLCLAKGQTHACHTPELWALVLGTSGIYCPGLALPGLSGYLASSVK